jgi:hypothetical protein
VDDGMAAYMDIDDVAAYVDNDRGSLHGQWRGSLHGW